MTELVSDLPNQRDLIELLFFDKPKRKGRARTGSKCSERSVEARKQILGCLRRDHECGEYFLQSLVQHGGCDECCTSVVLFGQLR